MTKQLTEIPRHTIDGAISGNAEDLAFILGYFSGYIKKLATRTLKDEYFPMYDMLRAWNKVARKYRNSEITKEEYDNWRYNYPEGNAK